MIKIYTLFSLILIPFIKLNIYFRVINNKEDKNRFRERYGLSSKKNLLSKKVIWIHAASIGEFKSSDFIIENYYKNFVILITTTTKSAAEYVELNYSNKVLHQYAPLDVPLWIQRFINNWKPDLVLWIESDLWPNTLHLIKKNNIKCIYLNARISPKSFLRWKKNKLIYKSILNTFSLIFSQSLDDLKRLEELSNLKIDYIGNLKLTNSKPKKFIEKQNKNYHIMLASTHKGEEAVLVDCLKKINNKVKNIKYYIAPRHPERSNYILNLLNAHGFRASLESERGTTINSNVIIIDSFGNMEQYYHYSDIVILGGSFINKGGHNPIEVAKYNCAIISGTNTFNWKNIYEDMNRANACIIVNEPESIIKEIDELLNNKNLLNTYKKTAFDFSCKNFFEEEKLINIINQNLK